MATISAGLMLMVGAVDGVAKAAPAPPSPDAELIRLADAHAALGRQSNGDFPDVIDSHPLAIAAEARRDVISDHQAELLDRMMGAPPTTLAGFQAVAAALVVEDLELLRRGHHGASECLTVLLVRGLLAVRGAA